MQALGVCCHPERLLFIDVSCRSCSAHGIHGSVLVPIMIWILVKAPPTGKALPNLTTSMPMPLMWFWIVVDFLAILLGGSDSKSKKE